MTKQEKTQLTEHFKLYEFTRSGTAIQHDLDNTPGQRSRWAYNKVRCHPVFVMDGAPTLHILLSCSDGRAAFVLNK